jgi:hypothetical protein
VSPETNVPQVNEPSVPVRKITRATTRKNKGWFNNIAPVRKATSRHTLNRDYGRRFTHDDLDGEYPADYDATVRDYTTASKIRAVPEDMFTHTPGDIHPHAITYDDLESVSNDGDAIDIDDIDIDLNKADSTDDDELFDAEEGPAGTQPHEAEGRSSSKINDALKSIRRTGGIRALKLMRDIGIIRDAVYEKFDNIMRLSSSERRSEASNTRKNIVDLIKRIKNLVGFYDEDFGSRTHEFEIYNQAAEIAKDIMDRLNDIQNGTDTRAQAGQASKGWGWPFSGGRRRTRRRSRRRRARTRRTRRCTRRSNRSV